ncbi:hypothetical protein [Wenyingzhuangia sp. IMCC45467]
MKKIKLISIVLGIILIGGILLKDYLPPRTPIKVVRIYSGLSIPKSTKVINFKEDYSFTGEGKIEVKLKLSDSDIKKIKEECLKLEYKKLTVENLIEDEFLNPDPRFGFNMPNADLRNINTGFYKLKVRDLKNMDFSMLVLNLDNKELSLWALIP